MSKIKWGAVLAVIFELGLAGVLFFGNTSFKKSSETVTVAETSFIFDSSAVIRSLNSWMIFTENFHASYADSTFMGNYQLAYPLGFPLDTLENSEMDSLLLLMLFGKDAPKKVNRKSIQVALDKMMKDDVKRTHSWWDQTKIEYGKNWRDEVCFCTGYFYAMPTAKTFHWISIQQISDYRCGGNGGPVEEYYTIVRTDVPYVMDTTAFVPGFREKLVDMITNNVIYNFYLHDFDREIDYDEVHQATANQFKGNFQPSLTLSGVRFVFDTWALPGTCHADGRVPVIVPYRMIQEIFTQKFKDDIGLSLFNEKDQD